MPIMFSVYHRDVKEMFTFFFFEKANEILILF